MQEQQKDAYGNYYDRKGLADEWLARMGLGYRLYRLYDENGGLLYIGKAQDPRQRIRLHYLRMPWMDQIASVVVSDNFLEEDDAYAAETAAIKSEHPKYNRIHNGRSRPRKD